ncbi:MAG: PfkB family carbohydrate kinase [Blautia hansenii]
MTIKEIAKLAGVSISTVSKIVNNKADNINIETRNRVLKIVKEYNYTPYGTAKNISNAKTFVIGVLLRHSTLLNLMLKGIMDMAQKHGYNVLLCDSMDSEEKELKHITALCRHHVDGVIWEPVSENSIQYEHYFQEQDIAISYINSSLPEASHCLDFMQMGYLAAQKLLDYRHTHIACLTKPGSFRSKMVFEGFKKCLFDNEIPYSEDMKLFVTDPDFYTQISLQGFTGIVSTHFEAALSLYEKVKSFHYHIPSDLSLISLREDAGDAICFPRISSLQIPYEAFGEKVCYHLIAACENLNEPEFTLFTSDNLTLDHEESLNAPPSCRYKKIVSVGSINTDITLTVDELPSSGGTTITTASCVSLGGKGANQAIGAARLGREVVLIGKIGNDYDSTVIYDTLKKEHVLTHGIRRSPTSATGKAYIHVQKDAESCITVLPGANETLSPEDILSREHLFDDCGYCLISTEIPMNTCIQAAKTAHFHHAKTIVKPATLKALPTELLANADIFVPNKREATILCPSENTVEKQADYFYRQGCPVIIITLGHQGSYVKTADFSGYFPAADFPSIDSTGGADAFIAAFASYLTEGYPLLNTVKIATHAAGFCISRTGVVPALIDRTSLENHIKMTEPTLLTLA